ncbi:Oligopeptide ABC transporter, periplasmic oligopeptide-binding protein OppA (TC 3.A.1.5.1) [Microbacterium esteraromaticum]|uniref:Oligopeptide ABC transporter, periplasmic oligopeptide-binding protein OppA (TC 3.A.1.5.1) n=1 Tax=Microbacterium esteraromaticum TaxID=57043 RepID=A0A1R4INN8_9MICO|nr:peptide ABC transporter substrate-binding protein [Microbacterium esteraromaticum]SJN21329.1 Oligopeptide ABC transporter, periplasmic oligopeptide-binding protein OppA (TC 3.A.1.5.1) [Microbacterium esteraromaticum]
MKKYVRGAAALVAAALVLSGCSAGNDKADGNAPDQKIVFAVNEEADSLDPGVTSNSFASPVIMNAFEPLVTYDAENNLVGGLAEKWDVSDDGLEYTFHLRPDLKWSDGSALTSEDFLYSWFRVLDQELAGQYANLLTDYIVGAEEFYAGSGDKDAVGISAPDADTFVVKLKTPTPFFLPMLNMFPFNAVKQDVVEGNADTWAKKADSYVSNGAFMVSDLTFGKSITLTKNPNYWDADNVKLEELTFRVIPDQSTALTAFESGQIDGISTVPTDDLPRLKTESEDLYTVPQFGTSYFIMNLTKAPFDDPKVRKALSLAIDRQALIDKVLQSTDQPATGIVAPGYVLDDEDFTADRPDWGIDPKGDVDAAKKLLAEAGYPDGEGLPAIELSYYTDDTVKKVTEAIQQMWKKNLGIDMAITTQEWKVYYDGVKAGDFDIAAMGWGGDYLHPMTFLAGWGTNSELNNAKYSNPEFDALLAQINSETDAAKGAELMHQAEEIMMGEDSALINTYYRARNVMFKPSVEGWRLTPLSTLYFKGVTEVSVD